MGFGIWAAAWSGAGQGCLASPGSVTTGPLATTIYESEPRTTQPTARTRRRTVRKKGSQARDPSDHGSMGPFFLTIPVLGFQSLRPSTSGQQPTPARVASGPCGSSRFAAHPEPKIPHTGNLLPVCPTRDWAPFCAAARASSRERARADGGACPCRRPHASKTAMEPGGDGTI